jgi:hypothetical protein
MLMSASTAMASDMVSVRASGLVKKVSFSRSGGRQPHALSMWLKQTATVTTHLSCTYLTYSLYKAILDMVQVFSTRHTRCGRKVSSDLLDSVSFCLSHLNVTLFPELVFAFTVMQSGGHSIF